MTSNDRLRAIIFGLFIISSMLLFFVFPRVATPLLICYVLTLILNPLLLFFERFGINRTASSALVVTLLLFLTIYPIVKVTPLMVSEVNNLEIYIPKVENFLKSVYSQFQAFVAERTGYHLSSGYLLQSMNFIKDEFSAFVLLVPKYLGSALELFFIVPLFLFFTLKDMRNFRERVTRLLPNKYFEKLYHLSFQFNRQIGDYILAKVIEASILGVIIFTGLFFLDIRFSLLFGLLAAVTNIIPYLGPVFGAIPAFIFIAAEYGMGTHFGGAFILYMVANVIDIAIVFPLLVSKIVDLHPVLVVVSVILGSQLLGITGMIISIPLAAAVKLLINQMLKDVYEERY
ncbi:AI-2E family transporter [Halobacteriovorax sp. GFR7]|uniref:AI-2E family transporter n=1 Tax=unclassified Halobacteriovorax TaxID=2639665 RepID=UPI003D98F854